MTGKIIALVDGSLYSASVCEHAVWIAARTEAAIEILHLLDRPEGSQKTDLSGAINLGARTALMEELAELDAQRSRLMSQRGRAILDDASAIVEKGGIKEVSTRLRYGDVIETLAEIEGGASLILVGKRGQAADFAKGHLGSNLERIIRSAHKPVMVAAREFRKIDKVLVAFDGGTSAKKAVEYIAQNPLFSGLSVSIVSVGGQSSEAERALFDAAARVKAADIAVEARIMPGQPEKVLGRLVEDEGFDLVVMGAYGHSRIRTLIIGSTTSELIRSCKVPILLLR